MNTDLQKPLSVARIHRHNAEKDRGLSGIADWRSDSEHTQIYMYWMERWSLCQVWGGRGVVHRGGAGVSRGYLNRQELTAEKFVYQTRFRSRGVVPDCTGVGIWGGGDPDGSLEVLGPERRSK